MRKLLLLSAMALSVGCSSTSLTPAAKQIKFVDAQPGSECQLLGQAVGEKSNWFSGQESESGSMRGAANDLRNKAAAMGGNVIFGAYSPTETFWSGFIPVDSKMAGQVYRCPE